MNDTSIRANIEPLPETFSLGPFRAQPRRTAQTGQLYWDVYFSDRSVGQLDGLTAHQAAQAVRAMLKVEILADKDTKADIRKALGC